MNYRQLFFEHLAQTSPSPIGFEIERAEGIYQYTTDGRRMVDVISGFSVANIGHSHPKVVAAVKAQAERYMHLIVYGEFIQQPQVAYAAKLAALLPPSLQSVYFTNSGAEATEGAMKLAKRVTGRHHFISFAGSYHGSTQGALSLMGGEFYKQAYRPLLPGVRQFGYGQAEVLNNINEQVAAVVVEPVQAETGVTVPPPGWLQALRDRCNETGALLIFDEIQAGFGRTGSLWAFEESGVVPDILLLGKALGGGMPLGAFVSSQQHMNLLTERPVLGHISTFGGHPVSCAAGLAGLEVLLKEELVSNGQQRAAELQQWLHNSRWSLHHSQCGLWASLHHSSFEENYALVQKAWQAGLITDWFLFAGHKLRLAPPLSITQEQWANVLECLHELKH